MPHAIRTHGVLLRRLIDHLDGAVEAAYAEAGLDYRPRFTPILRALEAQGPSSLRALSGYTGVTHSAISQTVAQMVARGWLVARAGQDARERIVDLSPYAHEHLPTLKACWSATAAASRTLDADIGEPLSDVLIRALDALDRQTFGDRLAAARNISGETE